MKTLKDCFGHAVRLADERLAHILEHPEMKGLGAEIERMLLFVVPRAPSTLVYFQAVPRLSANRACRLVVVE
jgi:hypothetical protein